MCSYGGTKWLNWVCMMGVDLAFEPWWLNFPKVALSKHHCSNVGSSFTGLCFDPSRPSMAPQASWRRCGLALSVTSAIMCLHLGAPQTLLGPQYMHSGITYVCLECELLNFLLSRLDLCDFVAATSNGSFQRAWSIATFKVRNCLTIFQDLVEADFV